jgi:L-cysteate sulfo-lyase
VTTTNNPLSVDDVYGLLNRLPRVRLAHLPTPLDECERLSEHLGIRLRVKREDCTGLALGGNKVREHEYVLADAVSSGADCIVQGAASQSNHSRQLAAAGAKLGLDVHLLPRMDARSTPAQGNFLLDKILGAHLHPIEADASSIEAKESLAAELVAAGRKPYIVGMGVKRAAALAAVAYLAGACEIVEADPSNLPSAVVVASQGSTQAGLQLAFELLGLPIRVYGINPLPTGHEAWVPVAEIVEIARMAAEIVGVETAIEESDVYNTTDYAGPVYGEPTEAGMRALSLVGQMSGIILDPVYSAKAFSGLVDLCERGVIGPGEDVVFIHTGGLPIVFAYAGEIEASLERSGSPARQAETA